MSAPPRMGSTPKSSTDHSPAWAFAGLLVLLAGARISLAWPLPLPFCLLKKLTGIPCPLCGTTRCLQAFSRFDFAAALFWNPLALLAGVAIAAGFIAWAVDRLWHRRWLAAFRGVLELRALKFVLIGAVVLNWIYLWRVHR